MSDLETVAATLNDSLVVVGCGPAGERAAARLDDTAMVRHVTDPTAIPSDAQAVFAAIDPQAVEEAVALARRCREAGILSIFVTAVEPRPDAETRQALVRLRDAADALVLTADADPGDGLAALIRLVAGSDAVNLDLADVETVCATSGFAAIGIGHDDDPEQAVAAALDNCGPVSLDRASGALVHLDGDDSLSVQAAGEGVATVRDALGADSHVIWGGTTGATDGVTVRVVLAGVIPVRPPATAGDSCPRCGATLVEYTLGDNTTIACEGCGFADVSASLGERKIDYGDGS